MELLRVRFDKQVRAEKRRTAESAIESQSDTTLKPWREVVNPHKDVHSGNYDQAEFAADLWRVAGSIIASTAYTIHRQSPTKVGTYAYVNPVVAVILGYLLGGEALGMRTILGTLCVLMSVVLITRTKASQPAPVPAEKATP